MALVRLFSRMNQHVFLQFFSMEKRETADFTIEIVVAALHGLHRLPVFVRISIAVVHRSHDFVVVGDGHDVVTVAVVFVTAATVHRLLLLFSAFFGEEVANGRIVAGAFVKRTTAAKVGVIAAHRRQIAERSLGDATVFVMIAVLDRVDDEMIGEVGSAFATKLTFCALEVFIGGRAVVTGGGRRGIVARNGMAEGGIIVVMMMRLLVMLRQNVNDDSTRRPLFRKFDFGQ